MSAGISYNYKGPLRFYNDPAEPEAEKPYKPRKPRRPKVESDEQYQERVTEWESQPAIKVEITPKENSITQKFYTKEVLPVHLEHIKWLQETHYR